MSLLLHQNLSWYPWYPDNTSHYLYLLPTKYAYVLNDFSNCDGVGSGWRLHLTGSEPLPSPQSFIHPQNRFAFIEFVTLETRFLGCWWLLSTQKFVLACSKNRWESAIFVLKLKARALVIKVIILRKLANKYLYWSKNIWLNIIQMLKC